MYVTLYKIALTIALLPFGITPAWCGTCGELWQVHQLEAHIFEEVHEYDHGHEIATYELDICPECVEHWYE